MATQLRALNRKKPQPVLDWKIDVDTDYDEEASLELVNKGKSIFSAQARGLNCCAFNEVSYFNFGAGVEYSEELQTHFNKLIAELASDEQMKGSFQMLIATRTKGKEKATQPQWFIDCLENYPGSFSLPWTVNHSHEPANTEVKAYFLPTLK